MPKSSAHQAWLVAGTDEAAVKKEAAALVRQLAPEADAFGLDVVDGAADTAEMAAQALRTVTSSLLTLPFLSSGKLVWLKNATFLSDSAVGRAEAVVRGLEELCDALSAGLPAGNQFLLSAIAPDKRKSAWKKLSKLCRTTLRDLPDAKFATGEGVVADWMLSRASERGMEFEPGALEALAARIGLDSRQLDNELEKLEIAAGRHTPVSASLVRELVPQTREGGIFDLSEAIQRRDLEQALATLRQLLEQGETPVGILLAAIAPTLRHLLLAKDLLTRHSLRPTASPWQLASAVERLPEACTAHLPRKKDGSLNIYPLALAAAHTSNYTLAELESAVEACAQAAEQLFSSGAADEVVLARLLAGLLARG